MAGLELPSEIDLITASMLELKTPLTLIRGTSSILESESYGELTLKQKEQVRYLSQAAQRLSFIVESLEYIKLHKNNEPNKLVQIKSEIKSAAEVISTTAANRDITIQVNTSCIAPVLAHPKSIKYLLTHVLANAVIYAPSGSLITISLRRSHDRAIIEVDSQGRVIRRRDIKNIRRNFSRLRQPVFSQGNSSGLSLYIINTLAEKYGGDITSSTISQGCRVSIKLPLSLQLKLF